MAGVPEIRKAYSIIFGGFFFLFFSILSGDLGLAQIQGSAGQMDTKPFSATVALREGYDSNPLTQSYQSTQDIQSSTYTSVQPSVNYNYDGLQAYAALRYDFSGTYYPSLNQSYDIQYAQTLQGRYTYQFDPRTSLSAANNFVYTEQPQLAAFVQQGISPLVQTNASGLSSTINNLATLELDYRVTDRLSMITKWNNTVVSQGGSTASSGNYMNNGAFQQFRLDFTPETVGTFTFDYQLYDYNNDNTYRDNQQVSFSVGADHTFLPELSFSGRVGIQLNDNFGLADNTNLISAGGLGSGEQEIGATPFASISSTWSYEQRSFMSAGFSMQVQQSNLNTSSDSEAYTLNLNWDHQFTEKFSVIQSFFVNLAVFTPELTQQQTQNLYPGATYQGSGQQTTVTYQCKFAYQFLPYLSAELGWTYNSYGSYFDLNNGNGGSYTRNQVYLGLRGTY